MVNELAQNAAELAPAYKVTLIPEDGADDAGIGPLTLPYNPEQYEVLFSSTWEPRNAAGVSAELNASDWQYAQPDTLTLSMLLQPQDPDRNDEILKALRVWTVIPSSTVQRPSMIRVLQGSGKRANPFTGHISEVRATARQTDATGRIITLDLDIRFVRNPLNVL